MVLIRRFIFMNFIVVVGFYVDNAASRGFLGFKDDREFVVTAKSESIAADARTNPECSRLMDIGYCSRDSAWRAVRKCRVWQDGCRDGGSAQCFDIKRSPFRCFENGKGCSKPLPGECSWYSQCLEAKYKCGPSGYPNFVEFYCRKFYEMCSKDLSEKGAFWCSETRRCLIEQANEGLLGRGSDQKRPTCADVHKFGFDSHPSCYTQRHASFCDLSVEDIAHVIRVVKIQDMFKLDTIKQMLDIAKICMRRDRQDVAKLVQTHFKQLA